MNLLEEALMSKLIYLIMQATKNNLKDATGVDRCKLALKTNLENLKAKTDKIDLDKLKNVPRNFSNLKSETDKLDVDKLTPVPVDLSKLSDVVKNDVVKKEVYNSNIKNTEDEIPNVKM